MSRINRIIESWRSWRRWSAVDRSGAGDSSEAQIDRALREGSPRSEGADLGGGMRGRVMNRILSDSVDGVSVGTLRADGVLRDRIGWVVGAASVAGIAVIASVIALRSGAPAAPTPAPLANSDPATHAVPALVRETDRGVLVMDVPVGRIIRSVGGEPLEDEARRLMSDVKRAAAALQERLPRLSFAEGSRGGAGSPGM